MGYPGEAAEFTEEICVMATRFIRVRGRVIPIRDKKQNAAEMAGVGAAGFGSGLAGQALYSAHKARRAESMARASLFASARLPWEGPSAAAAGLKQTISRSQRLGASAMKRSKVGLGIAAAGAVVAAAGYAYRKRREK